MIRHFLRDDDLTPAEQARVLALAAELKRTPYDAKPLAGPQTVAMIFDKQTLRTQASFAAGIAELGGHPMLVDGALAGIGVRESVADVARVLGRQASVIVWRTYGQDRLEEMAEHAGVPVVNALTDDFHPCQLLADLLTIREHKGELAGLTVAFVGDGACNMGNSWLLAGATAGHARPDQRSRGLHARPRRWSTRRSGSPTTTGGSVAARARPARGGRRRRRRRHRHLDLDGQGGRGGGPRRGLPRLVGHDRAVRAWPSRTRSPCTACPAYRGKEIDAEVIDGPQSVVWDEAENRRHAQKAILTFLLEDDLS